MMRNERIMGTDNIMPFANSTSDSSYLPLIEWQNWTQISQQREFLKKN